MKISNLLKYISDLHPQNTPARLALYNFLRHFLFMKDDLTPQLINRFFNHALEYPHWQSNKAQLSREIQSLLENFVKAKKINFDFAQIIYPQNCQIIELQNFQDVMDVTMAFAHSMTSDEDKYKVIPDFGRKVVLVILHPDQSLTVMTFDKKFILRKGILEPLRIDLKLEYNSELNLKENVVHSIEVAPYLLGQFQITEGKVKGALLRGYVFQKFFELNDAPLEEQPKIFVAIKRIEQFFIERNSDPYYRNIVTMLEKLPKEIIKSDRGSEVSFIKRIETAEIAFSEIFIGDKIIGHLIQEARYALQQKGIFTTDFKDQGLKWQKDNFQNLKKPPQQFA